jgi:hypothetical protein
VSESSPSTRCPWLGRERECDKEPCSVEEQQRSREREKEIVICNVELAVIFTPAKSVSRILQSV